MSFTRNSFTKEDYAAEQCMYRKKYEYNVAELGFVYSPETEHALVPGFGVYNVTNVPKDYMSRNAVDIESRLRGIRANDFIRGSSEASSSPEALAEMADNRSVSRPVQFFERPHGFANVSPIPCVDPTYQERERPPFH